MYIICQKLWLILSFCGGVYQKSHGKNPKEVDERQNTEIEIMQ